MERSDLKKLSRKLNSNINTFSIQNKFVQPVYTTIINELDPVMKEILADVEQEREMAEAQKELQRGENMIKYRDEINSRPKKEWFMGAGKRGEIARDSKDDLKRIKTKFEDQLGNLEHNRNKSKKKREVKREEKK